MLASIMYSAVCEYVFLWITMLRVGFMKRRYELRNLK